MPSRPQVTADLRIAIEVPGSEQVTGSLTGSGTHLDLEMSNPYLFAGRQDSATVGRVAELIAASGFSLTVSSPSGPLVTLGGPRTHWWDRWVTGSRHVHIARGAGLWSLARGRARASAARALPSSELVPPGTLWPISPTWGRPSTEVTTTHDPQGGGHPRLIMAPGDHPWPGDVQGVYSLNDDVTTIGSAPDADVRLPGLEPRHAEIHRLEGDEYVLRRLGLPGETLVNGALVDEAQLRTATRIQLGPWQMSYFREEFADHGRPYGGRQGGERGHQRSQAPRAGNQEWSR